METLKGGDHTDVIINSNNIILSSLMTYDVTKKSLYFRWTNVIIAAICSFIKGYSKSYVFVSLLSSMKLKRSLYDNRFSKMLPDSP